MDDSTSVGSLKRRVVEFRDARDWLKFHNPKDLSTAISIESVELQELFLWKDVARVDAFLRDREQLERVRDELADIGIFLLSLSDVLRIDLSQAILNKLRKNDAKYPVEQSRGSSRNTRIWDNEAIRRNQSAVH